MIYSKCHPDRQHAAKGLCHSCYNNTFKPTKEQNKRRNATSAAKVRKSKWLSKQGVDYIKTRHRFIRYNLTPDEYESMLSKQGHKCRVCLQPFVGKGPCIDHNHATGEVRSLLCSSCNSALGMAKENPFIIYRLLAYLEHTNSAPTKEWKDCRFVDLPPPPI